MLLIVGWRQRQRCSSHRVKALEDSSGMAVTHVSGAALERRALTRSAGV